MDGELRECPFCGGEADVDSMEGLTGQQWFGTCQNDDCVGWIDSPHIKFATKREATAAWNTRASLPSTQPSDVVEALRLENDGLKKVIAKQAAEYADHKAMMLMATGAIVKQNADFIMADNALSTTQQAQDAWEDTPDEYTAEIATAHPMKTGDHDTYQIASKMIGNRHGKGALIDLMNWLLRKQQAQSGDVARLVEFVKDIATHEKNVPHDHRDAGQPTELALEAREILYELRLHVPDSEHATNKAIKYLSELTGEK